MKVKVKKPVGQSMAVAAVAVRVRRGRPLLLGQAIGVRGRFWRREPGHCRIYLTRRLPKETMFLVTPIKGGHGAWVEVQVDKGVIWAVDVTTRNIVGKRVDGGFYFVAMELS